MSVSNTNNNESNSMTDLGYSPTSPLYSPTSPLDSPLYSPTSPLDPDEPDEPPVFNLGLPIACREQDAAQEAYDRAIDAGLSENEAETQALLAADDVTIAWEDTLAELDPTYEPERMGAVILAPLDPDEREVMFNNITELLRCSGNFPSVDVSILHRRHRCCLLLVEVLKQRVAHI